MKDLLKIAIVLPLCFNTFLWGQTAKTAEISTFAELINPALYDTNTEIKKNITFQTKAVAHFEKGTPFTIYGAKQYDNTNKFIGYPIIDGNKQGYYAGYTPEADGGGTGFGFFKGTNVTIKDLNFTNFTHRQRGTIYLNNSTGILDNITMTGFEQYMTDGHIWGSMVAFVDSSLNNEIRNSTFQNVDLKLHISHRGGDVDSDGGVLHVQGSQGSHVQSSGKILNSNFLNNKLTANRNIYGAAVYNEGILSEITDSKFEGNTINATGALTESTKPTIDEQMLKTGGFGGALSLGSHYTGRGFATITELKNTQFLYNKVTTNEGYARGGALWSGNDSIINEINNCIFTGNSSVSTKGKASGGALYINGDIGKIVGSTFTNNYVQSPNEFGEGGSVVMTNLTGAGGAIFTKKNITIQDGTTFSGNSVKYEKDGKTLDVGNDIHLSVDHKQNGSVVPANLTITTSDKNDVNKNFVSILSGIASRDNTSTITVKGGAKLNLSGTNKFFTGQTNIIENSILDFTQNNGERDSFLGGTVKVDAGSVVNFANTHTDVVGTVKNLIGAGTFNKTGAGHVEIQNTIDNAVKFTGHINLEGGELTVNTATQTNKGQPDFSAKIGKGTTLNYNNGSWVENVRDDSFTLDRNSKFEFAEENSVQT